MVHQAFYIHFATMFIKVKEIIHSYTHSFIHSFIRSPFKSGDPNLCANSSSITFFAWNFKIFFAILTDIYRPFGLRRKPWMLFGWTMVLVILMVSTYLITCLLTNHSLIVFYYRCLCLAHTQWMHPHGFPCFYSCKGSWCFLMFLLMVIGSISLCAMCHTYLTHLSTLS